MELTHLGQVIDLLALPSINHMFKTFKGFNIDSRALQPEQIYIALKGGRVDGHDFIDEAIAKGASAAIVSKTYRKEHVNFPLIIVEDPLKALQQLAQQLLLHRQVRIVGVTGSIGKTTTKEFIKTLLSLRYRVSASPGNSNSQVGLPLAILNHTTGKEEILILEMSMTSRNHIAQLVQIAPPEVALITKVALVHAGFFNSLQEIASAKAEIFSHPKTLLGIIDDDLNEYSDLLNESSCKKISFSTTNPQADYYLNQNNLLHDRIQGQSIFLNPLKIPGKHNRHNGLAAVALARYFNLDWEVINQGLSQLELPERRLQFVEHKGISFINDSYNASELSVKAALETLPQPLLKGKKIAVLGSMLELGKFSDECHRNVGEFALEHVDRLYCLGEECQPICEVWNREGKPVALFTDRAKLVETLRKDLNPTDVVLLKGSRSKELWKVLEEL